MNDEQKAELLVRIPACQRCYQIGSALSFAAPTTWATRSLPVSSSAICSGTQLRGLLKLSDGSAYRCSPIKANGQRDYRRMIEAGGPCIALRISRTCDKLPFASKHLIDVIDRRARVFLYRFLKYSQLLNTGNFFRAALCGNGPGGPRGGCADKCRQEYSFDDGRRIHSFTNNVDVEQLLSRTSCWIPSVLHEKRQRAC